MGDQPEHGEPAAADVISAKTAGVLYRTADLMYRTARRLLDLDDKLGEVERHYPADAESDLPATRFEIMAEGRRIVDQAEELENLARVLDPEPTAGSSGTESHAPDGAVSTVCDPAMGARAKNDRRTEAPLIPYDRALTRRLSGLFCGTLGASGLLYLVTLLPVPNAVGHLAESVARALAAFATGVAVVRGMLRSRVRTSGPRSHGPGHNDAADDA